MFISRHLICALAIFAANFPHLTTRADTVDPASLYYDSYYSTAQEFLEDAIPHFNGWGYFLINYNRDTTRRESNVITRFATHTIVSTNPDPEDRDWDLQIGPMIFLNFDFDRNITSVAHHYSKAQTITIDERGRAISGPAGVLGNDLNSDGSHRVPELAIGAIQGPYRVSIKREGSVGVGLVAQFLAAGSSGADPIALPFVGVAPIKGISVISERNVKDLAQARSVDPLRLPKDATELKGWAVEDRISYSTSGGILFVGGVGMPGFKVGLNYLAKGLWNTEVKKIDSKNVLVKIGSGHLESLGAFATAASLLSISISKFDAIHHAFSFRFDLSDAKSRGAYENLLRGNAKTAQLLADSGSKNVQRVESSDLQSRGVIRSLRFGIPGLNVSNSRGDIIAAETANHHLDGSRLDADYGIYIKERDATFFGIDSNTTYGFYASAFRVTQKDKTVDNGYFGTLGWSFKNSDVDQSKLKHAIDGLVMLTGLRNELKVNVTGGETNRGYGNVEFSLNLDQRATDLLMKISEEKQGQAQLQRIAGGFIDSTFGAEGAQKNEGQQWISELADRYAPNSVVSSANGRGSSPRYASRSQQIAAARSTLESQTRKAMAELGQALLDMRAAKSRGERKDFVKAYAQFGKAMLRTPFAFQAVFNLVKGRGASLRYAIAGEQIRAYELTFDWKAMASTDK